ncbi:MAG TPA: glycosyltransferase family 2 protein [Pyrinomonadaceae bacterium]|nr:glycosyltransferase family 2 protein [Pyrinomonadaceae bacterium]
MVTKASITSVPLAADIESKGSLHRVLGNEPQRPELSIVMPCLNEAETLETCIRKAQEYLSLNNIAGEVVVADNGSTDGSQAIAARLGARVVPVRAKGYGSALLGGIAAARGEYVIMGDADNSYDFTGLSSFVEKLREGYDLVMGNRFRGGIKPGAMPPLHRYLGNPVLTGIGRLFFHSPCGDFHCGLRGFRKEAIMKLNLRTTGMEFASEMVVKATLHKMNITEVPTTLSPDGRSRAPHLRSWRDGWRHLRFLLLYSPRWLFLYPGGLLMLIGLITGLWLLPGPRTVGHTTFDVHTLLYSALAIVLGCQAVLFAVFTKVFAISEGLLPDDPQFNKMFRFVNLEVGLIVGTWLLLCGLGGSIYALSDWEGRSFGLLNPSETLRLVIPASTSLTLGFQIVLSSFFLSVLGLKRH